LQYLTSFSCQIEHHDVCILFNLARPAAEVLEWLQELFDLMSNNGAFKGDGRTLNKIGQDLHLDETSLIAVLARTPQKSALKLFRLLYPTVGGRAKCGSISNIPKQQLENIYGEFNYHLLNYPVFPSLFSLCSCTS
jgi:hypothetical protein